MISLSAILFLWGPITSAVVKRHLKEVGNPPYASPEHFQTHGDSVEYVLSEGGVDRVTLGASGDFSVPEGCSTSQNKTGMTFCFYGSIQTKGGQTTVDARLNLTDIIDPNNSTMIGLTATYDGVRYVSLHGHFGGCAKVIQYGDPSSLSVGLSICTDEEPPPPSKAFGNGFLAVLYNAKLFLDFSALSKQLIHSDFISPSSYVYSNDGPVAGSHMRTKMERSVAYVSTGTALAYLSFKNTDDTFKEWSLLGGVRVSGSVFSQEVANRTFIFLNKTIILE
ncbi:hypothetical protein FOL47_007462 [Perkinsus chesapeaki]|uniref:Uncharacterized protein n=1 Tax=Perkinsus chesapeaki TaxID=330153 RepID=A0A7J6LKX0_PERCH|nr:hypothetical protein FOL47_007462 [Perkinsus chesapeaki]